ncbi:MAG: SusC/RagA family TonB-linked outer membrane protein [Calditrichaeota bacterium]|nr:MAG: SusC/RagA family TonB-linked outer membrane protein [Calditrichota bacterium]MBL1206177.1 SusC/RagA family TonB-linked outer membrane protein [Calditrichota bacterium]NOG46002.1 SusC/RagA family TonB-linked outer membrane protein [Calditrichota bacterium]
MTKLYRLYLALFSLLIFTTGVFAQNEPAEEVKISGSVVDENNEPLPGVNIQLKGTFIGTSTDIDGLFSFHVPFLDGAERTLTFSFVGYRTEEVNISVKSTGISVTLYEDILRTSEIVVTGIATSVKRQNLANSVGSINSDELLGAPTQSVESAMAGKMPGMVVSQNTGAPGGGVFVNLRGVSTIEGKTEPLYVVDGMIVNNSATQSGIDRITEAAGAGSSRPQGQPVNRIADINPNDIENVEVLKGASAAAIYGAKASNGVIIITTKKGSAGKTKINVSQRTGYSSILNTIGARKFNAETAEAYQEGGGDLFRQNGNIDYEDIIYGENGLLSESSISASGGTENTQFYISGLRKNEDGIVKNTGYEKLSGKINLSHRFSPRLKLDTYSSFINTEANRAITGNDNSGTTFGVSLAFTPGFVDLRPKNGVYPDGPGGSNPIHTRDALINRETVYRAMNSAKLTYNLLRGSTQNLDFIFQGGFDYYSQFNKLYAPAELQFEKASGEPVTSINGETRGLNTTAYFSFAHSMAMEDMVFNSSAGFQIENEKVDNTVVEAHNIPAGQSNVDLAARNATYQTINKRYDQGVFFQEEISLEEKIYLTFGLRADRSSAHGDVDKFFTYPKASGSIRLSEYDFWEGLNDISNDFKLRAAWGQTGNSPIPAAKYRSFTTANIDGQPGLIPRTQVGDPNIKPERTTETEFGVDASFFEGLVGIEFSYYMQTIEDLILISDLPLSSGFQEKFSNAGEMETKGLELSVISSPLKTADMRWDTRINFSKTESEITKLNVDPFNKGGFATSLGTYRIEEGKSPTSIIGNDADGNVVDFGDETPDFEMGFSNSFSYGNFNLSFLFHWKQGGDVINLGRFLTDLGQVSDDWEKEKVDVLDDDGIKIGEITPRLRGDFGTGPWIEDGTYIKLREASLTYNVDKEFVNSWFNGLVSSLNVGISGRNLFVITDYSGYDPEVSNFGNVAIGRSVDVIPFPSARSIYFNVSLGLN